MATDPLDMLIITETVEILQAFLDAGTDEWSITRLANGTRVHSVVLANVEGKEPLRVALGTIEALSYDAAQQMMRSIGRQFRPQFTVFVGRAMGSSPHYELGDLFLAQRVYPDNDLRFEAGVILQEAKYFEASQVWREAAAEPYDSAPIKWAHPLWLPPASTSARISDLWAKGNPPISPFALADIEHLALHSSAPRMLVLGVERISYVERESYQTRQAQAALVPRRLAAFVLTFFPEQIHLGNIRTLASPTQVVANDATVDDATALLLRDLVDGLRVASVTISNFKNISSLALDLNAGPSTASHWTCIAGVNGAGKSAVLQAIVIALLGDRLATELGGDWLQRTRRLQGNTRADASIAVTVTTTHGDVDLRVAINTSGIDDAVEAAPSYPRMRNAWKARANHHILRAYGPGRNLSEHLDNRYSKLSPDVQAVMTLFDPLTQIASAEAIIEKAPDSSFLPHLKSLVDYVFQDLAVEAMLEGTALRFAMQGAELPAVDLPDGFRATLAWLADLCLAWFVAASEADRQTGVSTLRATVLIDEIDLHLHPKLQRSLIPRLREKLPHVQWIVTTHSPLVLGSFDSSEIVALEPDPVNGVRRRVLDRSIMGFTLDEIVSWLMETPPHSLALDEIARAPLDKDARLALLLSQSPDLDEEDAKRALEAARDLRDQADAAVASDAPAELDAPAEKEV